MNVPQARLRGAWRVTATAALLLMLSACGFHLRGQAQLPPAFARTCIEGASPDNPVFIALAEALRANGVKVVQDPAQAGAVLQIVSLATHQRALTISALNQATSYAMSSVLVFSAHATQGQWRLAPQTLSVQRQYTLSTSQLLSQGQEERFLSESMAREIANGVLLRLQAATGGQ